MAALAWAYILNRAINHMYNTSSDFSLLPNKWRSSSNILLSRAQTAYASFGNEVSILPSAPAVKVKLNSQPIDEMGSDSGCIGCRACAGRLRQNWSDDDSCTTGQSLVYSMGRLGTLAGVSYETFQLHTSAHSLAELGHQLSISLWS